MAATLENITDAKWILCSAFFFFYFCSLHTDFVLKTLFCYQFVTMYIVYAMPSFLCQAHIFPIAL